MLIRIASAIKTLCCGCSLESPRRQGGSNEHSQYRCVFMAPGRCVCFLEQETFTPQKVLVIPRNSWLRLNMTEKLFTGTLNHNKNKKIKKKNYIHGPLGAGDIGDIAGLKCRNLTPDVSRQCRGCAGVLISR